MDVWSHVLKLILGLKLIQNKFWYDKFYVKEEFKLIMKLTLILSWYNL